MKIFGLTITRAKAVQNASPVGPGSGGWWSLIREPFTGAWQQNREIKVNSCLAHTTVYACVSLIASDIAKLRLRLVSQDESGIWTEVESPAFSPVLRRPNRYANRIQFVMQWVTSKLIHGATFVLKDRDARGVVTALYILDPTRVTPLVADDGTVFYELHRDNLSGLQSDRLVVPSKEIIHDVMTPLYHPLVGVSPIRAAGLAAVQGLAIQNNSTRLFEQGARPGGIITAPGHISDEVAQRLKAYWETSYGGENTGKTAVLGDGLTYQALMMNNADAQLIEQLRWSAEQVCSAFHVPAHMVGVGQPPTYNNIENLNQAYYSQTLQSLIESIELLLDEGLELPEPYGTEFDLDGLLRMDSKTRAEAARQAIQSGVAPNEIRKKYFDLGPTPGGETPYMQEQNWPLSHLAARPLPSQRPVTEPEPLPSVPDEAEARRLRALREATREFHRLADQERMTNAKVH